MWTKRQTTRAKKAMWMLAKSPGAGGLMLAMMAVVTAERAKAAVVSAMTVAGGVAIVGVDGIVKGGTVMVAIATAEIAKAETAVGETGMAEIVMAGTEMAGTETDAIAVAATGAGATAQVGTVGREMAAGAVVAAVMYPAGMTAAGRGAMALHAMVDVPTGAAEMSEVGMGGGHISHYAQRTFWPPGIPRWMKKG